MRTRLDPTALAVHRRAFLGRAAQGVGAVALASLLDPALLRAEAQPRRRDLARPDACRGRRSGSSG